MVDVQPEIGDRVTYIDNDGERHRALVVDPVPGDDYITCVTSDQGRFIEDYTYSTTDHTSVYPHTSIGGDFETSAFIPSWTAADEGGDLEALAEP